MSIGFTYDSDKEKKEPRNTFTAVMNESNTVLSISARQKTGYTLSEDYNNAPVFIMGNDKGDITLTLGEKNTLTVSPFGSYAEVGSQLGYIEKYPNGCTLTKK